MTVSSAERRARRLRGLRPARRRADPGPGHLRHLVQLGPVAVLDPRLARRHRRTSRRYYPTSVMETGYDIIFFWVARMMMLGLAADRRASRSTRSTSRGSSATPRARRCRRRRATSSTRSAVIDEIGRRRPALRADPRRGGRPGPALRADRSSRTRRNFANKLWNATRFVARRATGDDRRGRGAPPARRRRTSAPPSAGSCRARARDDRGRRRGDGRLRLRRGHPARCTTRSGTSSATGGSSWPRSGSPTSRCRPRPARRRGGRWSRRSTPTCVCSTR